MITWCSCRWLSGVNNTNIADYCNTYKSPCLTLHVSILCHSWLFSYDYSFIIAWHSILCLLLISLLQVFWPTIFQLAWDENFEIRILKLIPSALIYEERYQKIRFHKVIRDWLFEYNGTNKSFSLLFFSFLSPYFTSIFLFFFSFFSFFSFLLLFLVNKVNSF